MIQMKALKLLTLMLFFIGFSGCDKNESEDLSNIEVNRYVELLKAGKYDSMDLPAFTYSDIPALLEYRNETQKIKGFPVNMISSMGMLDCSLGMYILWTIESIRAVAIDSEYLIARFPSQNPIVQKKESGSNVERGDEVQQIVSKAYFDWWNENKHNDFEEFKNIDPLSKTKYRWH